MSTSELLVIDPAPDTTAQDWRERSWMAVAVILGDITAGIIAALTGNNPVFVTALAGLVPAGIALHLALTQVEKAEVR